MSLDKKQNGVVFTPEWIADFMVEEVLNDQKITGQEKILDAGCGEGVFTIVAAEKFAKLSGKSIEKVIEENIYFIDISKSYIEKTKQNLQKLSKNKIAKYNATIGDFCFNDFDEKFDFIIGNPPYVRIQNLNDRRELLQKKFITASNGSIDLYFCFFERALNLLKEKCKISFYDPGLTVLFGLWKKCELGEIKEILPFSFNKFRARSKKQKYKSIDPLEAVMNFFCNNSLLSLRFCIRT